MVDDRSGSAVFSQRGIPKPGDVVDGKYRIEDCLGSGGMGAVLAATRLADNQSVALKVMLDEEAKHEDSTKRFFREAKVAGAIDSPHVARLLDLGRLDTGAPFMVLELLEGEALDAVIRDESPLPVDVSVDYMLQACEGVAEAHARGVIHRDLKPSNLFRTHPPGRSPLVKVLDFGISKATLKLDPRTDATSLTETEMTLGSPQYMSPEQLKSSKDVDARTDIWSLGLILHKLIAGRAAFEATTVGAHFAMILSEPAAKLRAHCPDAPAELERTILMCLVRDREQRWQDVGQLATALARFGSPGSDRRAARIVGILERSGVASVSEPGLIAVGEAPTTREGPAPELLDGLLTDGNAPTSTWSPVATSPAAPAGRGRRLALVAMVAVVIAGAFVAGRVLRDDESTAPAAATSVAAVVSAPAANEPRPVLDKQQLLDRVAARTATKPELLMLQAFCMRDGDEACQQLAVSSLTALDAAAAPDSSAAAPNPSAPAATNATRPPAARAQPTKTQPTKPAPIKPAPIKPKGPLEDTL